MTAHDLFEDGALLIYEGKNKKNVLKDYTYFRKTLPNSVVRH